VSAVVDLAGRNARPLVLLVAGTRQECIKLSPLARALQRSDAFDVAILNSGQQLERTREAFAEFGIRRTMENAAMPAFLHLQPACDHLEHGIREVIRGVLPATVVVAGNTPTAYAAARAARAERRIVAHLEAGLRTDHSLTPFPEEWLRRELTRYAQLHFACCRSAVSNLSREGIPSSSIHLVGSTAIDSLASALRHLDPLPVATERPSTVVVTLHRSENHDRGAELVCEALIQLGRQDASLRFIVVIYPDSRIGGPMRRRLRWMENCEIRELMPYRPFVDLIRRAALVISDSAGIQEEAPHLGVPLLAPRVNSERPEAIQTGWVRLADARRGGIAPAAMEMINAARKPALPIDAEAPFGPGNAASRIVRVFERRADQQRLA
jgi:UDP-N-acetylglucosamine 2-epimerase (non-hydrolysing)